MLLVLQIDEAVGRVPAGERINGNIYALAIWEFQLAIQRLGHQVQVQAYIGNLAAMNSASTSSILAVYGILPTYRRRPSLIAWGTCAPGRLKAAREVLGLGFGLALGLALVRDGVAELSAFMRQLAELKARPSVRTFAKGDLVGAVYCRFRSVETLWGVFFQDDLTLLLLQFGAFCIVHSFLESI